MKEIFEQPELEVIQLDEEEILVQSGEYGTASMRTFNAFGDEEDEEEW